MQLFKKCISLLRIWSEQVLLGWFGVFQSILACVPAAKIQTECLLLAECLSTPPISPNPVGDQSERLLSRKIGAMIICHLTTAVPTQDYAKKYLQYLRKLADDANWEVRQAVAERLPAVCDSLAATASQDALLDIVSLSQCTR